MDALYDNSNILNMKYFLLLTFTFSFLPVSVFADEPMLDDYAEGYELNTDGSGAIYRVPLPAKVYKNVVRKDLGDIRVFNSQGQRIPFAIRKQEVQTTEKISKLELPFFPLQGETGSTDKNDMDIHIADDGHIINIQYKGSEKQTAQESTRRYIIDLSGVQQGIDQLEFDLRGNQGGYLKRASLEASNDLNSWHTVVHNAALSELNYANHSLRKNTININNGHYKYLRFSWDDDPEGLQLENVHATLNSVTWERQKTWTTVTGKRSEKEKRIIEFDTGGIFPVEEIDILLPENNTLIEATLRSRDNNKANWRTQFTGLVYRLNMKGTQLEQGTVHIRTTTDRYWQLEMKDADSIGNELPQLKIAWEPNELYFLARGDGPYTLAFGNAEAAVPGKPVDALMRVLSEDQESELIQQASLGNEKTLKGADALKPSLEIPWQRILLWGVLVLGVIIIAFMVIRLYHQIDKAG